MEGRRRNRLRKGSRLTLRFAGIVGAGAMGGDVPAPTVDSAAWDRVRGEPWEIWVVAGAAEKQVTRRKRHDRDNRFHVEGVSIFKLYINVDSC